MSLQDRIDDEIYNLEVLPDPLTPEQRKHLATLECDEMEAYVEKCIKENSKSNQ